MTIVEEQDSELPTSAISRRRSAARRGGGPNYEQRRREIIQAAAEVFRSRGFRGTSLTHIAEAVGADRATLYYYVGGKAELFDEIVTDVVCANLAIAEGIRDSSLTVPEKLEALVSQLMCSYAEHYPFLYVYLQENLAHVAERRLPWARRMRSVNRRYESAVQTIIEQGIAQGSISAITDARVMAYGLLGMVSWTNRWFVPDQSSLDAAVIGAAYSRLLLDGMAVRPGELVGTGSDQPVV